MIQTIVFDFGNVIGFFDNQRTLQRLAPHTELTAAAIRAAFIASRLEEVYESGQISTPAFLQRLRELGRLHCSDETVAEAWSDIFRPNPDVCALLPALRPRYRLLLGSNTTELHARQFRRQFAEPLSHFEGLVLSYEIGVRKPGAGFFEHCQKLAGCAAGDCLFIDDMAENVDGAQALGWHGIVYSAKTDLRAELKKLGVLE